MKHSSKRVETDIAKATNSEEMLKRVKAKQVPSQELPAVPEPGTPKPPARVNRVGQKVTYRAAIEKDGKWVDGPGEMNRTGYVITWGLKWVTILNLEAKKVEYAIPSSVTESNGKAA